VIESNVNLGFAGGNNLGIRAAQGEYLLLLNNDTEVDPGFLEPLVSKLESNEKIGVASPKVYYFGTNTLQYAGAAPINRFTGRGGFIGDKEDDTQQYNVAKITNHAHGAAMIFSRKLAEKVGLMSEFYFLYYEELDFCEKIKRAGYTIWYVPESVVYHKESMSVGKNSIVKTFYMTRNRILFMKRNVSWINFMAFVLFFVFISMPKNLISLIKCKDWDNLRAFSKGVYWHLTPHIIPESPRL